jgi:hypothetical protein
MWYERREAVVNYTTRPSLGYILGQYTRSAAQLQSNDQILIAQNKNNTFD